MATAVRERRESAPEATETVWFTQPVHGNSKRLCEVKKSGQPCGKRATHETCAKHEYPVEDVVFHCDDSRHIAYAHKRITELVKTAKPSVTLD